MLQLVIHGGIVWADNLAEEGKHCLESNCETIAAVSQASGSILTTGVLAIACLKDNCLSILEIGGEILSVMGRLLFYLCEIFLPYINKLLIMPR